MSNQVYSDVQGSHLYNGDIYSIQFTATSNGTGAVTGNVSFEFSRVDARHGMMAIVGSQSGVAWGANTTQLVIPSLSIPAELRPRVDQFVYCTFFRPVGTVSLLCRVLIAADGGIQFAHVDVDGAGIAIQASDQVYPATFVYPIS